MPVHFDAELQGKLSDLATRTGRKEVDVVQAALIRYIEYETGFMEAVERGIAAAERGEFVDEEEMRARIERILTR
jgi:predicted transcriptional regulator